MKRHDHGGIDSWSARRYRLHLADHHASPTRGYTWLELQALHDEQHATSVRTSSPIAEADETADETAPAAKADDRCPRCAQPVAWSGKGRRPRYCSANCRKRAEQDRRRADRLAADRLLADLARDEERRYQLALAKDLADRVAAAPAAHAEALADWIGHADHRSSEVASILRFFDTHGAQLSLRPLGADVDRDGRN